MKPLLHTLTAITLTVAALAAAPARADHLTILHHDMPQFAIPGAAQAPVPMGYTPAPTPNVDMYAPVAPAAQPGEAQWHPNISPPKRDAPNASQGLIPGSGYTEDVARSTSRHGMEFSPTLSLKVPLE